MTEPPDYPRRLSAAFFIRRAGVFPPRPRAIIKTRGEPMRRAGYPPPDEEKRQKREPAPPAPGAPQEKKKEQPEKDAPGFRILPPGRW